MNEEEIKQIEQMPGSFPALTTIASLDRVKKNYAGFIFNEEEVYKNVNFIFAKIDENTAGIGLYLPKDIIIKTKSGDKQIQENKPVFIVSNPKATERKIIELDRDYQDKKHRIKCRFIPDETAIPRRWNLTNIQHFLALQSISPSINELYEEIKRVYQKYTYFDNPIWYSIHALWDISTYFYMLFDYFPIMELRGYMRSGKTKIMGISRLFTFNPSLELTNPSEATLFREGGKTQYIDEAEKIFYHNPKTGKIENDTRAEVINSGFKKTGVVPRQEKFSNKFITINYSTYSPRMIASINGLYGATEDRAIIHITTPAPKNDPRGELEIDPENKEYKRIICLLHVYLLENWQLIEREYIDFKNETKLKTRDFQLWKPILLLAREVDMDLYKEITGFAEKVSLIKSDNRLEEGSLEYHIIKISLNILEDKGQPLVLKDIAAGMPERYNHIRSKTISGIMNKLGFMDFSRRTNAGMVYDIDYNLFLDKIKLTYPNILSSFSSHSSLHREKEENGFVKVSEENMVKSEEKQLENFMVSVENVENVESEGSRE